MALDAVVHESACSDALDAIERLLLAEAALDASIAWADLVRLWPLLTADERAQMRERAFDAPAGVRQRARRVMTLR